MAIDTTIITEEVSASGKISTRHPPLLKNLDHLRALPSPLVRYTLLKEVHTFDTSAGQG